MLDRRYQTEAPFTGVSQRQISMLPAARIYQGQVTNFRTPGGGFAPVF
ncbi:hypothetical protein [Psychrobacter sp. LV10R520-6]|nr:hypothetical protein [Psychrobacter sp. LV10R520-6]